MKNTRLACASALILAAAASLAHATTTGLNTAPLGTHGSPGIANALWDIFPNAAAFSNAAPAAAATAFTSISLGFSGSGMLLGDTTDNRIYDGGNSSAWALSAQTPFSLQSVTLQVKITQPGSMSLSSFFTPTLDATPFTSVSTTASGEANRFIVTYTWSGLSVAANTPVSIRFGNSAPQQHVSLDAIALDASANPAPAPEPTSIALIALAAGIALTRQRRRTPAIRQA